MGLLDSFFGKKKSTPLAATSIRDTLFGDMPLDQWPNGGEASDELPWGVFVQARQRLAAGDKAGAIACWRRIIDDPSQEPRSHLQAWHFLGQQGQQPAPDQAKQLLGVVIEVGMPDGLDLLAAYPDHTARYYNYSGSGIVWEHPDASLDSAIDQLLEVSRQVLAKIGPWDKPRPAAPGKDHVRMSFLTPSGLHFGQGPMDVLSRDPMGGPIIHFGAALMSALIAKRPKS